MGVPDESECFDEGDPCGAAAARTQAGTLASRPDASGLPAGARYFAADDRAGTLWVVSGGGWVQAAPAVAGAAHVLDITEPASAFTVAMPSIEAPVRMPQLTLDFIVPDAQRVRVDLSEMSVYEVGDTDIAPKVSLRYSTNGWASSTVLLVATPAPTAAIAYGFEVNRFEPRWVLLPTSIAAGTSLSVAAFMQDDAETGTYTVAVDLAGGSRPVIVATAI
jgi:hypothetical protein